MFFNIFIIILIFFFAYIIYIYYYYYYICSFIIIIIIIIIFDVKTSLRRSYVSAWTVKIFECYRFGVTLVPIILKGEAILFLKFY